MKIRYNLLIIGIFLNKHIPENFFVGNSYNNYIKFSHQNFIII